MSSIKASSKHFNDQKEAVMKSVLRKNESINLNSFGKPDDSSKLDLNVLLVNDEFFILCMLQQIVKASGITKIDQA